MKHTPEMELFSRDDSASVVHNNEWEVTFHFLDGAVDAVEVRRFSVLHADYPGACAVRDADGRVVGWRAWCWTKCVGDYDDWQFRHVVTEAARVAGLDVPESLWYVEEPADDERVVSY